MCHLFKHIFYTLMLCFLSNALWANFSIPFELINGLIIVKAEINGTSGNFVIDSGSNGILLNRNSEITNSSYETLTNVIEGSETKIEHIKVGDFELNELLGFSTDLSNIEFYLDKSIAGVLSASIFTPNSLVFDFENSQMIISVSDLKKSELQGLLTIPYKIIDELPMVELKIGNNMHTFILDSGASSHFVDQEIVLVNKEVALPTGVEKSIITAGGKDQISLEYKIENCTLGNINVSINAFQMDFDSISNTLGKEVSGLLSLSKLSKGKVYMDLKSKIIYYN